MRIFVVQTLHVVIDVAIVSRNPAERANGKEHQSGVKEEFAASIAKRMRFGDGDND